MRVDIAPQQVEASPDETVAVTVDVYNSSDIIEGFRVELDGLPAQAWRAEPASISLFPDTSNVVVLTLTPPAMFPAGSHPLTVRVVSTVDPSVLHTEQLVFVVHAKKNVELSVAPEAVTGGAHAKFMASVRNRGNVPLNLQLAGDDQEGALTFGADAATLAVEPGGQTDVPVRVRGRRPFLGAPKPRMLSISAAETGLPDGVSASAPATFVQKPWVPRSLLIVAAVLAPVAILALVLTGAVAAILGTSAEQEEARVAAERAEEEAAQAAIVNAPPGSIQGTVEAPGQPAFPADVSLYVAATDPVEREREVGDVVAQAVTEPDGTYVLPEVTTPATYQAVFTMEGFAREAVEVELGIGEGKSGVDAVLRPLDGAIAGTVMGEAGPVGGVTVTASDGLNQAEATTATEGEVGTFILDKLPTPGTYTVAVSAPGTPPLAQSIALAAGERLTDVVLQMPAHVRVVGGVVRDGDGQPLGEVAVLVSPAPEPAPAEPGDAPPDAPLVAPTPPPPLLTTTSTEEDTLGRYSLQVAAPARYEVSFKKEGYVPATRVLDVTADQDITDFDVVLPVRSGAVTGTVTVVDRPGACAEPPCPVPDVAVRATGPAGERSTVTAGDPAGAYVIEGLRPGVWTLTFAGDHRVAARSLHVEVLPGVRRELDVVLEGAPGTIRVRSALSDDVVADMRAPCSEVTVIVRDSTQVIRRQVGFDEEFVFAGLATPNRYSVQSHHIGDGTPQEAVLGPGGHAEFAVDCRPPDDPLVGG